LVKSGFADRPDRCPGTAKLVTMRQSIAARAAARHPVAREVRRMSLILVIEDDPSILRGLQENLQMQSYRVEVARDGATGRCKAIEHQPDLIILDLMLPEMDGLEVCRSLRASGFARPILMLTAKGSESDRVHGLDLGADDYVTKPFSVRELLARVRALLRRAETTASLPDELAVDDVLINFRSYEASKNGEALGLTRKEFAILRVLAACSGEAVTRDELLSDVWGYERFPTTRTVDTHMGTLRAKIETNAAAPERLLTVHGIGYKLRL
jgi:DNA-binding response OmpR family regulator